ncbi:hypothetical protein L4D76_01995 [Photobacterium sagamiensis]|uniref:hypothetical protein n=1 Tax=Photobacterium sagamiensis TaxID=2910241 RepID=UPI003D14867A
MKIRPVSCAILLAISGVAFTAIADEKETIDFKQQSWDEWRETFNLNSSNNLNSQADKVIEDDSLSDADKWIRLFNLSKQQYDTYAECGSGTNCESIQANYEIQGGLHPGEGEGMGLLAKELGYKPGSKEFKDLKKVIKYGDTDALNRLLASPSTNEETKAFKVAKKEKAIQKTKLTDNKKVAQNNKNGAKEKSKKDKNKT